MVVPSLLNFTNRKFLRKRNWWETVDWPKSKISAISLTECSSEQSKFKIRIRVGSLNALKV